MLKPADVSVVIPLFNEEESLSSLSDWIIQALEAETYRFEIIFIDDGSTDASWKTINELAKKHTQVSGIRFVKNYGKSQALHAGFEAADGKYVVTLDADLQDSPEEIPQMIESLKNQGYDLISGWKKKRYDSIIFKTFLLNSLTGLLEEYLASTFTTLTVA